MSNPTDDPIVLAHDAAEEAYEVSMENGDDRLSLAIREYIDAIREEAMKLEDDLGASPMYFMVDLHDNIAQTLQAGL